MSWFGDIVSDVGHAIGNAASGIGQAVIALPKATIQSVDDLAHLRVGAAFRSQLNGLNDASKPLQAVGRTFVDAHVNMAKGAVQTVSGLAEGDLGKAGSVLARGVTANTPIAILESQTAYVGGSPAGMRSPTGFSGLAYGNDTLENRQRAAFTTAVVGAAAGGAAIGGSTLGSSIGSAATTAGGSALTALLTQAKNTVVGLAGGLVDNTIGDLFGGNRSPGGTNSAPPYSSPGSSQGSGMSAQTQMIVAAGIILAGVYVYKKGRK